MSKFTTTKQKLRKLWEQVFKNTNDLTNLNNQDQLSFFSKLSQQQINKNIIEFYNSNYFETEAFPPTDSDFRASNNNINTTESAISVNKDTLLPQEYRYNKALTLNLPENYLPFLKFIADIKAPPSHNLLLGGIFIGSEFGSKNDIMTISGDGNILYKGNPSGINDFPIPTNGILNRVASEEVLNKINIPIENTKKIYNATILYSFGGEDFGITGVITGMTAYYDTNFTCNQERDIYDGEFFQEGGSERHDNEILSMSDTSFSIKSQKAEIRWVDIPPCSPNNTIINGVTKTDVFTNTTSYSIQMKGAIRNLTTDTFVGNNQLISISTAGGFTITSKTITFAGYRGYYDSSKQGVLATHDIGINEGNFNQYELSSSNLPNTANGHTLNYNTIAVTRNESFDTSIFETDKYIQHSEKNIPIYFKQSDNKFFVTIAGKVLMSSPAIVLSDESKAFPLYDDKYTQTATTYTHSQENHSLLSIIDDTPNYMPEITDIQARVRIYLQNPLYWIENRKYEV